MVEVVFVKIVSLLKVVFGDVGMDILFVNLKGGSEFNCKVYIIMILVLMEFLDLIFCIL